MPFHGTTARPDLVDSGALNAGRRVLERRAPRQNFLDYRSFGGGQRAAGKWCQNGLFYQGLCEDVSDHKSSWFFAVTGKGPPGSGNVGKLPLSYVAQRVFDSRIEWHVRQGPRTLTGYWHHSQTVEQHRRASSFQTTPTGNRDQLCHSRQLQDKTSDPLRRKGIINEGDTQSVTNRPMNDE